MLLRLAHCLGQFTSIERRSILGSQVCVRHTTHWQRVAAWCVTRTSVLINGFDKCRLLVACLALIGLCHANSPAMAQEISEPASEEFPAEAIAFFENKIRPLLAERCWDCHRGEELKGGLALDSRSALLIGGDSGPAVVPGEPDQSLLIDAVHYRTYEMPPDSRLSGDAIALLERWVEMGAPWPSEDSASVLHREEFSITQDDRDWWAYRSFASRTTPAVQSPTATRQPLDAFIQQKLDEVGLLAATEIDARRWQRRVWFDLVGLPPQPEEVSRFTQDTRPDRQVREVDRLLASPSFGVRWARHWLDVVRFAQTDGYERDGEKPEIWRYRDYVVDSFNADLPYDRFVIEQIAGDELPDADDSSVIATGFYRLGVWDDEPDDALQAEYDERDDMLATIGTTFLGSTIGCARCHRHMFDPFSQQDYYQLLAFVHGVRRTERAANRADSGTLVPLGDSAAVTQWRLEHERRVADLTERIEQQEQLLREEQPEGSNETLESLRKERESLLQEPAPFPVAMAVRETTPPTTYVLLRGNPATPGDVVEPRFPELFGSQQPTITPVNVRGVASSGRRTALAHWIVDEVQPLTARVIVNRLWHHLFGQGIAPTTSDFGKAGLPASHPELLDWLAQDLIEHEWSLKSTLRRIATSDVYARDRIPASAEVARIDPDNRLLSYRSIKRLEGEALRDSILAVSGNLSSVLGGRGFFPNLDGDIVAGGSRPGLGWSISSEAERSRRSLYTFIKRSMRDPLVEAFDYGNTTSSLSERPVTTVAPQALILLNSSWTYEQADALASWAMRAGLNSTNDAIAIMFERAMGRAPTSEELDLLSQFAESKNRQAIERVKQLVIRPNAPKSLSVEYLRQLPASMLIQPPSFEWTAHRGVWGEGYEGIDSIDPHAIPFVQWNAIDEAEGTWSMTLRCDGACERVSIFASGRMEGERFQGIEVRIEPALGTASIWTHQGESTCLGETAWHVVPNESFHVRLVSAGGASLLELRLSEGTELSDAAEPSTVVAFDASNLAPASVWGLASWGAPLIASKLVWESLPPDEGAAPQHSGSDQNRDETARKRIEPTWVRGDQTIESQASHLALVEVARLLFNANEFIYVD